MKIITIQLSEYNKLLNDSVIAEKLAINVKELINKNEELTIQNNELLKKQKVLEEKILALQRRLFDKKKDQIQKKQAQRTGKKSKNSNKEKRGRKPIDFSNIELTKYYDFATTPVCPCCTNTMEKMGSNDSYHEDYKVVIKKIKICKAKYICRDCDIITVANGCILPIRKGLPMPGFLAQVILDKFSNGMPLYRQAQNYGYSSYNYTRQMLSNWVMQAAELLMPLLQVILKKMLKSKYLAADETGIIVLRIAGKSSSSKAYMCVLKQNGEEFNFVYCWVIRSRKQIEINDTLKDFKGYLQSDGLNFYFKLKDTEGIILVNCWAHARRKFVEIIKLSDNNSIGVSHHIVEQIDLLYDIERQIKENKLTLEQALELRKTQSIPILNHIQEYLRANKKATPPKSKLGKAISYVLERWTELTVYSTDPQLDIDNNHTERCIKYIVMGRKAWLFADNLDNANKLGVLYSLIISCKINKVNPREYLEYILTQTPYINKNNVKELEQLLPDRFNLQKRFDQEYMKDKGIIETIIYHQKNKVVTSDISSVKIA